MNQRERVQLGLVLAPVSKRATGNGVNAAVRQRFANLHQPIGLGVGQRTQQHAIQSTEDRRRRSDAHREHADRDAGENRRPAQQAEAIAQVLHHLLDARAEATIAHCPL